jgi:hypothetical protein
MIITPELKQAMQRAGEEPLLLEDPESNTAYVIVKREVFERLLELLAVERVDRSLYEFGEFHPVVLEMPQGISVFEEGSEDAPRLPLLGLRTILANRLRLAIDGRRREVTLKTAGWL